MMIRLTGQFVPFIKRMRSSYAGPNIRVTGSTTQNARQSQFLGLPGLAVLMLGVFLGACQTTEKSYQTYLHKKGLHAEPSASNLQHCHGYGCRYIADVILDKTDWKDIERFFRPSPKSAKSERAAISKAIGAFEKTVGSKTGTDVDVHGTFKKVGDFQLDCVDESTNTTVYLLALLDKKLLHFHDVLSPTARFPLIHAGSWPHQSAVIIEKESGERYAVDSWFDDNGSPARVIPLAQWKEKRIPDIIE